MLLNFDKINIYLKIFKSTYYIHMFRIKLSNIHNTFQIHSYNFPYARNQMMSFNTV